MSVRPLVCLLVLLPVLQMWVRLSVLQMSVRPLVRLLVLLPVFQKKKPFYSIALSQGFWSEERRW